MAGKRFGSQTDQSITGGRMTPQQFAELVEEMRHAQKEYFRTRTKSNLDTCKRIEKRVDLALQRLRDGQKDLFEA